MKNKPMRNAMDDDLDQRPHFNARQVSSLLWVRLPVLTWLPTYIYLSTSTCCQFRHSRFALFSKVKLPLSIFIAMCL